jgi:hypothetical protein
MGGRWSGAHHGLIRAGVRGREAGGEHGRQRGSAVAAASRRPVRFHGMRGNTRAFELL